MWASTFLLYNPTKRIEMACNSNEIDWLYSLLRFLCCRIYKRQGKVKFYSIRMLGRVRVCCLTARLMSDCLFWPSLYDKQGHCCWKGGLYIYSIVTSKFKVNKRENGGRLGPITWLVCLLCNSSLACLICYCHYSPFFSYFLIVPNHIGTAETVDNILLIHLSSDTNYFYI